MFTFQPENYVAGAHEKIEVADSVMCLFDRIPSIIKPTTGTFAGKMATMVRVTVEDNPIYYTLDDTNPDTSGNNGHALGVGQSIDVYGWDNVKRMKLIRQSTNTANVKVTAFFNSVGLSAIPNPT